MKKFKIKVTNKVREYIINYMEKYVFYYKELFEDSGIWAEDTIINNYIFDSSLKTEEIYDLIFEKLSDNFVKYPENLALIKWRSKYLIVKFEDKEEQRIILDLEIR